MYPSNTANPYQSHDFITDLKDWWGTCPLFTKFLIFFCSGLVVLSQFSGIAYVLVNEPSKTIGQFQITRLIFCPFTFFTIAELLFAFIAYLPSAATQEKEVGTLQTIVDFFIKNLEINLLFIIICYLLSVIHGYFLNFESYGLWSILFMQVVERCLENPHGTTGFIFPTFQVPNKFYPLILLLLFTVVSNVLRLDLIVAGLTGFLNFRFLNHLYKELIGPERISSWESSSVIIWLRTLPNYVSRGSITGSLMADHDKNVNPNYPPIGDYGNNGQIHQLDSFGGPGITIGGTTNGMQDYAQMRKNLDDLDGEKELI